jgi:hypothetical protein
MLGLARESKILLLDEVNPKPEPETRAETRNPKSKLEGSALPTRD